MAIGWAGAILIPLAIAYAFRRTAAWMNAVAAVWVIGLSVFADQRSELMLYAWCAIGSAGMIAWGIYEFRAERINLGMAGFAITIIAFFFSSVMDKLGRSASLIALGTISAGRRLAMGEAAAQTAHASSPGRCTMTLVQKGLMLAGLHAFMVLSLTGKLLYDRSTCPRVWVRTAPWDPNLPIRGRYLSLQLVPESGAPYFTETNQPAGPVLRPGTRAAFRNGALQSKRAGAVGRSHDSARTVRRGRSGWG